MITSCRACGSKELMDILSLGDQYLSDFVNGDEKPEKYQLDLVLCQQCNLLQLKHSAPVSSLYTDSYGYRSGINQTMRNHLAQLVKEAYQLVLPSTGDIVIDIGCNDGTLLKSYNDSALIKIGFDPVKKFAKYISGTGIKFINAYFNKQNYEEYFGQKKARIITAISMFYDLDDPNTFISDLKGILDKNGILIIQQNYLVGMLLQNAFDNIVHEHREYYSLLSLEKLLDRHGFDVFDVELHDLNGGSFRTYICHQGARKITTAVIKLRASENKLGLQDKGIYRQFAGRIHELKEQLYGFIAGEVTKGKTIYVYGASTRGNTLLQYCGLDNTLIKKAVERNEEKWGKTIASVGIPIISEEQARKEKPDYMLVLPWFFKEEFVKREAAYIEQGGKLLFPLPKMEIVGK
jgi:hypothetical protein